MSWIGYIALSTVAYSFAVVVQRVLVQENKSHPVTFIALYQALVGLLVLGYGFIQGDLSYDLGGKLYLWLYVIAACFLYAGANYSIFAALERMQASRFTIAFSSRMFFTGIIAWIMLGERLLPLQIIGAILLFGGIVIANYNKSSERMNLDGLKYAVLGAVFFGLANVVDRVILQTFELYSYVSVSFLGTAVVFALLLPKKFIAGRVLLKMKSLQKIAVLSVLYGFSSVTFFAALQIGESASQVVSTSLVSVIVTVLFGILFLKERDGLLQKTLGASVAFVGVLLLV